jgi:carbonic anhydrase
MGKYDQYVFNAQPGYDEKAMREVFSHAIPLKTIVIHCYDSRAAGIPDAVAKHFGEVYPGEVVHNEAGNSVGSTASLFPVVVAGGRAIDALRSITVAQHLFGIQNVVVVHHTNCGGTSYTADGIVDAYKHEHKVDIGNLYDSDSVCITDFEASLAHDVGLIREHLGTPKHADIYGFLYDTDNGALTEVVKDIHKA